MYRDFYLSHRLRHSSRFHSCVVKISPMAAARLWHDNDKKMFTKLVNDKKTTKKSKLFRGYLKHIFLRNVSI